MNWHMNEKVMTGVIVALVINTAAMVWQGVFVLKTLDTDPPIVERVRKLEYQMSEQGRINQRILEQLHEMGVLIEKVTKEQLKFGNELSRRKPLADYIERQINRRGRQ